MPILETKIHTFICDDCCITWQAISNKRPNPPYGWINIVKDFEKEPLEFIVKCPRCKVKV